MKQLTDEEIDKNITPLLLGNFEMHIAQAIRKGNMSEIEIVEYHLKMLKGVEYMVKNYNPKDHQRKSYVNFQIHYSFENMFD